MRKGETQILGKVRNEKKILWTRNESEQKQYTMVEFQQRKNS